MRFSDEMHMTRGERRVRRKLEARRHRSICYLSKNDTSAPAPDPAIGQAAAMNADTARAELQIGQENLAWNKERWNQVAPDYQKILDQQVAASDTATARGNDQWQQYKDVFQPIENQVAAEAQAYGGDADQQAQAGKAIEDTTHAYDAAAANQQRALQAAGVNPNDPKYVALTQQAGLERAKAGSAAGTTAATNARLLGMSMRQNVAQFGRNMPATSIAQDASALNAGNSAQGNATGATMAYNAGVNSALPWYSGATDASTAAGNLGLGVYNANAGLYRTNLQTNASAMGGLGKLAGTVLGSPSGSAWLFAKDGGIVDLRRARRYADGGIADAGMSDGVPSGRMSDGPPLRDGTRMKIMVIALPNPAIDPTDGEPLTACDQPANLGDRAGLQRKSSPVSNAISVDTPGYADGGLARKFIAGQEQSAADQAATWGENKQGARPASAPGGKPRYSASDFTKNQPREPDEPVIKQTKFSDGGLVRSETAPSGEQSAPLAHITSKVPAVRLAVARSAKARRAPRVTTSAPAPRARPQPGLMKLGKRDLTPAQVERLHYTGTAFADGGVVDDDTQAPAPVEDRDPAVARADQTAYRRGRAPKFTPYHSAFTADFEAFDKGGLVRKSYDNGGMVAGPGTPTSDSVPAQLSDREGVINAEGMQIVGEDFVRRINQAGLQRREQGAPGLQRVAA